MKVIALLTLLLVSADAYADESCGLQAVRLLSESGVTELASLFVAGNADTVRQLRALVANMGELRRSTPVDLPRFLTHSRLSVQSPATTARYGFMSFWVNSESERLGPIQIQMALNPEKTCEIIAIHVDWEKQPTST